MVTMVTMTTVTMMMMYAVASSTNHAQGKEEGLRDNAVGCLARVIVARYAELKPNMVRRLFLFAAYICTNGIGRACVCAVGPNTVGLLCLSSSLCMSVHLRCTAAGLWVYFRRWVSVGLLFKLVAASSWDVCGFVVHCGRALCVFVHICAVFVCFCMFVHICAGCGAADVAVGRAAAGRHAGEQDPSGLPNFPCEAAGARAGGKPGAAHGQSHADGGGRAGTYRVILRGSGSRFINLLIEVSACVSLRLIW
jgi:hypothetical protein